MIPASFDYVAPTTVAEALTALSEAGEDAKVLGGGQSLLPVLRLRLAAPSVLIDLNKITELRGVTVEGEELVIDVLDGGVGIPEGFDIDNTSSLGLSIVRTLVTDMDGRFELGNRADRQGSRARVVIPVPHA